MNKMEEKDQLKVKIEGMYCSSCEILIERKFKKIGGVQDVKVSHNTGIAEITYTKKPSIEELQEAIKDTKYTVHTNNILLPKKNKFEDYFEIGAYFVILVGIYYFLRQLNLIPSIGISEKTSLAVVFLLGLVASVSSCMVVTGGLLISIAAKYSQQHPNVEGYQKFRPHIYFNIGRIVSYTLLGGLIGLIGSKLPISASSGGILTIIASLIMIILGLQMLKIFPLLSKLHIRMPKFIAHKMHEASASQSKTAPFLFGASTFFFPCGFTQALQFYVLTTGSFATGAATMLAFSLGTLPALMSVGALISYVKGSFQKDIMRISAVLVILLGLFNISNGLALVGISFDSGDDYVKENAVPIDTTGINPYIAQYLQAQSAPPQKSEIVNGKQIVRMKIADLNYLPAKFIVQKGVPVEWQIDASQAAGCAQVITIPKLRMTKYLSPNQINVIQFTPIETGRISFMCTMAMTTRGASFNVVDAQ